MNRWAAFAVIVTGVTAGCAASLILVGAAAWFLILRPLGQAFGQ